MAHPQLSVIIASCVGPPFITRCLGSLENQRCGTDVEFIVVDRAGDAVVAHIEHDFPWITIARRNRNESVPDLRRHGVAIANATHVAFIEEHCIAGDNWIATILRSLDDSTICIGGVVHDNDYDRLMDWAVYFTEYNSYMPPAERGPTYDVCAANCVYRRDLLRDNLPESGSGYWEAALNHKLLEQGHRFQLEPTMIVHHTGPFGFFYYLGQRFLFSRAFAGIRRASVPKWYRLTYLFAAPLLVPLLWARTAQRVFAKRNRVGTFLSTFGHMIPITCIYVLGEWVGYLVGPGDSLSRIE